MIENESQQGGAALMEPDSTPEPVTPTPGPPLEVQPEKQGLSSADVIGALRQLGPVVSAVALCSLILPGALGTALLATALTFLSSIARFTSLAETIDPAWTARTLLIGAAAFGSIMALATGSMLLPTYAMSFVAGAFFGLWGGGAAAMFGVTVGALVGYAWGYVLARGRVMDVIERHENASIVRRAIVDRSLLQEGGMVALIRVPANSPFALTNLLMSSTGVRLWPYLVGTFIGIAPRTLFAVWLGVQAEDIAQAQSRDRTTQIVLLVAGLVIFVLVYKILSKWAREALANVVDRNADA
ncbi:MAG: hypothetical protein Tsb0013_02640 [Phycisphaerales bacterium]